MKRIWLAVSLCLAALTLTAGAAFAQTFPPPQGFVNDFANLLSDPVEAELETELAEFEKETTSEIAVVTVETLEGLTVEDYAVRLFESWGIGKKDKDNGVLFIVAEAERKVRIEVGYGLEGVITDGRAGRLLDEAVIPSLRQNDFETGIRNGVKAIESYIRVGSPPEPLEDNPVNEFWDDYFVLLFVLAIVTIYLFDYMARSKSVWLGGIWGFIVGIVVGLAIGGLVAALIMPFISGGMGTGLDYLLSRNYKKRKKEGKSTSFWASRGGFSGGGHSGGFGGGHSGGGGASRGF